MHFKRFLLTNREPAKTKSQHKVTAIFNECYIEAIAGPFYNIMKVMMKGPNKQLNNKRNIKSQKLKN